MDEFFSGKVTKDRRKLLNLIFRKSFKMEKDCSTLTIEKDDLIFRNWYELFSVRRNRRNLIQKQLLTKKKS